MVSAVLFWEGTMNFGRKRNKKFCESNIYISREAWPRRNVYWWRPSKCLCVCLSVAAFPHYCTDPDVSCGHGTVRGAIVAHYWADLHSVHEFRCYDNIVPDAKCQRVLVLPLCLVCLFAGTFPMTFPMGRSLCLLVCGVKSPVLCTDTPSFPFSINLAGRPYNSADLLSDYGMSSTGWVAP